jgi:hypothetical protein
MELRHFVNLPLCRPLIKALNYKTKPYGQQLNLSPKLPPSTKLLSPNARLTHSLKLPPILYVAPQPYQALM